MAPAPPRADVAALRRSDRSKPLLLGLVVAAALVGATWSWAEQKGVGAPDEATNVMVVADGGFDHVGLLDRAGFNHPVQASLAELEARAVKLELDGEGIEAVLALADEQGYGFVAFVDPQGLDFSDIELQDDAPEIGPDTRYAVLSVGDLAFPHHLSVDPAASEVVTMPGLGLLQALYAQSRLEPERELLEHHPTVEELQLQTAIEPGLFLVRRVAQLESTASNLAVDIERRISKGATPLGVPMESGAPLALPDGGVLSIVQDVSIVSRDAFLLDYELAPALRLEYTPAGTLYEGPDRRVRCEALAGGELAVDEFPELVASPRGDVILVHTASKGLEVWLAHEGGRCAFQRAGVLPSPIEGEKDLGVPSASGRIARTGIDSTGSSRLRLYDPGVSAEKVAPIELAALSNTRLGKPMWLGERHVVIGGRTWGDPEVEPHDAVFVYSVDHPGRVLRFDATLFGDGVRFRQMAPLAGEQHAFLLTTRESPTRVFRIELGSEIDAVFERELEPQMVDGMEVEPSPLIVLGDEEFRRELLHEGGSLADPVVSPDGSWVVFSHHAEDEPATTADIAALRLDPPATELKILTSGPAEDRKPRFTADGKHVVFETRVELGLAAHTLAAPRIATLLD